MADKRKQLSSITKGMFSADVIGNNANFEDEPVVAEEKVIKKPAENPEREAAPENTEVVAKVVVKADPKEPVIKEAEKKPVERTQRAASSPARPKSTAKGKMVKHEEEMEEENSAKKTERPSIYMTKELLAEVKLASSLNGMTICSFFTMLVEDYLEKNKDKLDLFKTIYGSR